MWRNRIKHDTRGYAVVEATILFPIMIMIFAALVLLSAYLPQKMLLQEAAQFTATAIATEAGDTYVAFDHNGKRIKKDSLPNVYIEALNGLTGHNVGVASDKAEQIAGHIARSAVIPSSAAVQAEVTVKNYVIYKEISVVLTQEITIPVNLSFIGFPKTIKLEQQATAVVQNGDEFVRNIDIAKDMIKWLDNKYGISQSLRESGALDKIGDVCQFFGFGG